MTDRAALLRRYRELVRCTATAPPHPARDCRTPHSRCDDRRGRATWAASRAGTGRKSSTWNDPPVATPAEGLARLRAAADAGELDRLCRRHRIRVLTVFGSAARDEPAARDLDIGVLLERGTEIDYIGLIDDLQRITEANIDVVHLNPAGPVLRERALVGSVVLDESEPGAWAGAATAAMQDRMDSDWLRRMALDLLADR